MTVYKEDLRRAQRFVDSWWAGANTERPVLLVTAPREDARPYNGPDTEDLHDWFTNPDYVFPRLRHQLESTFFGGEAMPAVGPAATGMVSILNKFLGAENRYLDKKTTWSLPLIEDWDTRPTFAFDENNRWWRLAKGLMEGWVQLALDEELECLCNQPDLNGPTEVLSGLRTAQKLALDIYDRPEVIKPALREINDAWLAYWRECRTICSRLGGGFLTWMRVWSDRPSVDLQSDFSCLVGKAHFDEFLLPFIEEQTRWAERTIYHLDGPDSVQHLDSLLELPELDGIQWVQGAGAPPASEWIELYRRIQDGGKLVYALCEPEEVRILTGALRPEGLLINTTCGTEREARDLVAAAPGWVNRD